MKLVLGAAALMEFTTSDPRARHPREAAGNGSRTSLARSARTPGIDMAGQPALGGERRPVESDKVGGDIAMGLGLQRRAEALDLLGARGRADQHSVAPIRRPA